MNWDVLNVLNIGPFFFFFFRNYTDRGFLKHYLNKASLLTVQRSSLEGDGFGKESRSSSFFSAVYPLGFLIFHFLFLFIWIFSLIFLVSPARGLSVLFTFPYSVHFSHSVMSDSLQLHGLQHARLPCPSPTPRTCSNSCPLSWWCHPTISSSVIHSLPAFNLSQLW